MKPRSSDNQTLPDDRCYATSLRIPLLPTNPDSSGDSEAVVVPQEQEVTVTLRLRLEPGPGPEETQD